MGQKEDSLLFHSSSRFDCFTTDKSCRVRSAGEDLLPRAFPEGLPALTSSDVCVFNVGVGHTGVCTHQHLQTSTGVLCQRVPGYTQRYRQTWILPGGVERAEFKRVLILIFHFLAVALPLLLALSSDREWYRSFS